MASPPQVRVGVGVFILSHSSTSPAIPVFLVGQRLSSLGSETWALPGGHLEFGESFEECAAREVLEETGLEVGKVNFLTSTNDVMQEDGKHYVTVFMVCERVDENQEAEVLEKEKCQGWEWVSWETLEGWAKSSGKENEIKVFIPLLNLLKQRPRIRPALV